MKVKIIKSEQNSPCRFCPKRTVTGTSCITMLASWAQGNSCGTTKMPKVVFPFWEIQKVRALKPDVLEDAYQQHQKSKYVYLSPSRQDEAICPSLQKAAWQRCNWCRWCGRVDRQKAFHRRTKKGDLADLFVYKFHSQGQLYLLGYTLDDSVQLVYLETIGSHEIFYRDLKR